MYAIADLGSKVIVGGNFDKVTSWGSSTELTRRNIFAFDKATGEVDPDFAPELDSSVSALLAGPDGTVYVAGRFKTVNGADRKSLTLLKASNGGKVSGFLPGYINGIVYDLAWHPNGQLLLAGTFSAIRNASRPGLASVDAGTGALSDFLTVKLAGHHNWDGDGAEAAVGAKKLALSPNSQRLVVIGNFTTANGSDRDQVAMIDTGGSAATLSGWQTNSFKSPCNTRSFDSWVRDVSFAPNGSYFVVASSGSIAPGTLCDAAAAMPAGGSSAGQTPLWVAPAGGDSLLSVAVTEQAVYIGGHFRWMNNPDGTDDAEPGAIGRASIAALDPANGLPYSWNPGRNPRGFGVTELLATPDGLWLGYDTDYLGAAQYRRKRIGFFPLAGGAVVGPETSAGLPGPVYLGGGADGGEALKVRQYRGDGDVSASQPVSSSGVDWDDVRGAFWVGGDLFYGHSDGKFYRRTYSTSNGTRQWGTPVFADPYHDRDGVKPDWDEVSTGRGTFAGQHPTFFGSEVASVTGMFYSEGRIYYTRSGSGAIYWRWFTPESGAVGADRHTLVSSGFSDVSGGLFLVGNQLYFSRGNGALYRTSFAGGTPSGSRTAVSGPDVDGLSWRARAIFPAP